MFSDSTLSCHCDLGILHGLIANNDLTFAVRNKIKKKDYNKEFAIIIMLFGFFTP